MPGQPKIFEKNQYTTLLSILGPFLPSNKNQKNLINKTKLLKIFFIQSWQVLLQFWVYKNFQKKKKTYSTFESTSPLYLYKKPEKSEEQNLRKRQKNKLGFSN